MSSRYIIVALQLLLDHDNKAVSPPVFYTEFCAPLRTLEVWEKTQLRIYGNTAQGFASFHRVARTCFVLFLLLFACLVALVESLVFVLNF